MSRREEITWEKALEKALRERARELDILREYDMKTKVTHTTRHS